MLLHNNTLIGVLLVTIIGFIIYKIVGMTKEKYNIDRDCKNNVSNNNGYALYHKCGKMHDSGSPAWRGCLRYCGIKKN